MPGFAQNGAVLRKAIPVVLRVGLTAALLASAASVPRLCSAQADRVPQSQEQVPPPEARIDINHASVEQLLKVPGMTRSWAERIVRFRPYRTKQDLVDSGVVPSDIYKRIQDHIIAHHAKK
jgi:DNA uptake protein ComE-like DNA-binding protein